MFVDRNKISYPNNLRDKVMFEEHSSTMVAHLNSNNDTAASALTALATPVRQIHHVFEHLERYMPADRQGVVGCRILNLEININEMVLRNTT